MKSLPTLFKKSKSAIEQWTISFGQDTEGAYYEVVYGQKDGAMQTKRNYVKGKNIGRANETSPIEQAEKEADARWLKQKDKMYDEHLGEAQVKKEEEVRAMLAHDHKKYGHKVTYPALVQPKLDGVRALAKINSSHAGYSLFSRQDKVFPVYHLERELDRIITGNVAKLDGELYTHGVPFQQIVSWCKKDQPDSVKLRYRVYDAPHIKGPYKERFEWLKSLPKSDLIDIVETYPVNSEEELLGYHKRFVDLGYEGAMLRWGQGHYESGDRSQYLLKIKEMLTEEFEIVGAEQNKNSPDQCSFILKTKQGYLFKAKPEGTTEHREALYRNHQALIGSMMTVRFFEWTTSEESVPRFPIAVEVRNYE